MGVVSGNVKNCSSSLLAQRCILAPFVDILILGHSGRSLSENALLLSHALSLCVCICISIYILLYFTELCSLVLDYKTD